MNLMNLDKAQWAPEALKATGAAGLAAKLPPIVPSHAVVGNIHRCCPQA